MESPRAWSGKHPQSRESDIQVFPFLELTLLQTRNVQIRPLGLSFGLLLQNELETGIAAPCDCQRAYPSKTPCACLYLLQALLASQQLAVGLTVEIAS